MPDIPFEEPFVVEQQEEESEDLLAPFRHVLRLVEDWIASTDKRLALLDDEIVLPEEKTLLLEAKLAYLQLRLLVFEQKLVWLGNEMGHEQLGDFAELLERVEYDISTLRLIRERRELWKPSMVKRAGNFLIVLAGFLVLLRSFKYMLFSRPPFIMRARIRERNYDHWTYGYAPRTAAEWQRRTQGWEKAKEAAKSRPGDSVRQASLRSLHRSDMREKRCHEVSPYKLKYEAQKKTNDAYEEQMGIWNYIKMQRKFRFNQFWQDEGQALMKWLLARVATENHRQKPTHRSHILGLCKVHWPEIAARKTSRMMSSGTSKPPTFMDGKRMMSTATNAIRLPMHPKLIERSHSTFSSYRFPHRAGPTLKLPVTNRKILSVLGLSAITMGVFSGAIQGGNRYTSDFPEASRTRR